VTEVEEALARFQGIGGTLWLEADLLRYRLPEVSPEAIRLLEILRRHKPVVATLLREHKEQTLAPCGSPECAGCYEVESGRRIHPPKPSQEWLDWLARWQKPKGDRAQ